MTARAELVERLLAALRDVRGVRPATPSTRPAAALLPWDLDAMAIDVDTDLVEVKVVALALPLLPELDAASTVLRGVLDDSPWRAARLRVMVVGIDVAALDTTGFRGELSQPDKEIRGRDRGHTIES